jgi:hypothetical protein
LTFTNGTRVWSAPEIVAVDKGLGWLNRTTHNTFLLRLSRFGNDGMTFERDVWLGPNILADNNSDGLIRVADAGFNTAGYPVDQSIVHEIGHNWDSADENSTVESFRQISDWKPLAIESAVPAGYTRAANLKGEPQPWIYQTGTQFARPDGYGRTNPFEDFASSLETYYSGKNPSANWQAKWYYIDGFIRRMTT